jgi:plasmid stabilization system protein ParE
MKWTVAYTPRANRSLFEVLDWMTASDIDSRRFEAELALKEKLLESTPYIGAPVTDARTPGVRWLVFSTKHLLYYQVNEAAGVVELLLFWHSSRGTRPIL